MAMPLKGQSGLQWDVPAVIGDPCAYPPEAFEFVQNGLLFTVAKIHGEKDAASDKIRHVSGQQLCQGLREYALKQWGMMAATVLRRWNIHGTLDFGKIVFALVELKMLATTPNDTLDDFKNVYDFKAAFEGGYHIAGGK